MKTDKLTNDSRDDLNPDEYDIVPHFLYDGVIGPPPVYWRVIPPGTILYRATSKCEPSLRAKYCGDTGKTGLYFGMTQWMTHGMMFEYLCGMYQCRYLTTRPILVYNGKYVHLTEQFRQSPRFGCLWLGSTDCEQPPHFGCLVNHYDFEAHPINDLTYSDTRDGEIFIADNADLKSLKLIDCRNVRYHGNC